MNDLFGEGLLIADGAMGTMLSDAGLEPGECPEEWNVTRADAVTAVHRAYVEAGCRLVLTNTFGGSAVKLSRFHNDARVAELNAAAVAAAHDAGDVTVAASIGPTGELLEPLGSISPVKLRSVVAEQIKACADADLVWIETMTDLGEAHAAVDAARDVVTLPIAVTFTYDQTGHGPRTMMGVSPADVVREFADVDILGVNCAGVDVCVEATRIYRECLPDAVLAAKPNAGTPRLVSGQTVFSLGPADFAEAVAELSQLVNILGGCCGTTPAHIAEIAAHNRS